MVAVANASGIFRSFGYHFDDPNGHIQEFSTETKEHMDTMPPFITDWQAQDIANGDVGGYYENPAQGVSMTIWQTANTIKQLTNTSTGITGVSSIYSSANTLANTAHNFLYHTGRISGVIPFDGSDSLNPYLDMAIGFGRTAMYITNQTDGITNNAPIMGSFTSILVVPQLSANCDTLITYSNQIANSITINNNVASTNLTSNQITTITEHITTLNNYMTTRQEFDIVHYSQLKIFIDAYNKTKKLNNMGETEKYLVKNLIGTQKAKSRIS